MFLIAQKWTRAYTIADALRIQRPSSPEDWEYYWRLPDLATATYSGEHSTLWYDAITCVFDVDSAIREFCSDWEQLGVDGYRRAWWQYQIWPEWSDRDSLPILVVSGGPPREDRSGLLAELMDEQRVIRQRWESYVLRRRDGAGRPVGTTSISAEDYPRIKAEAIIEFKRQFRRSPDTAELPSALGIDKATYYRYEQREQERQQAQSQ